jgi:carboxymethylenebutenolidase
VRSSVETYTSGGETVRVELFVPTARGKHPAIVMLYGSGGLEYATGDCFRSVARRLAGQGYVTLIPHFFDRTAHVVGQPMEEGDYQAWREAVKDAIEFAAARKDVDPSRFGLLGYSLGSGLAYFHASNDERIKAVASLSGISFVRPDSKPPATLLLYGSKDKSVPAEAVKRFEDALTAADVPHASHVYRGMGHNFDVTRFADAGRRAAAFFDNHVKRTKPAD